MIILYTVASVNFNLKPSIPQLSNRERAVPENPAIWLVPEAGSIFLSPDHGHGNQLR